MNHAGPELCRINLRIELTPAAKQSVDEQCDRLGMTHIAYMSRALEWLGAQSDVIQAAVLGLYPGLIQPDIAELLLKRMRQKKPSTDVCTRQEEST